jgi:hypothetical protein
MSLDDMLSTFKWIHRTRIFDSRWTVVNAWASASISWVTGFLRKKFSIKTAKPGTVVVVLTQLDERYFVGLEGHYRFELHFVLQREGAPSGEHICRVGQVHKWENRSVSCEVELEAGVYEVIPKITASSSRSKWTVEEMVQKFADDNPQKVRQVGMQYDLAHAKPGVQDYDMELSREREAKEKKDEEKKKKAKAKRAKDRERRLKSRQLSNERRKKVKERQKKEQAKTLRDAEKEAEKTRKRNAARQVRREERARREQMKQKDAADVVTDDPAEDVSPSAEPKQKDILSEISSDEEIRSLPTFSDIESDSASSEDEVEDADSDKEDAAKEEERKKEAEEERNRQRSFNEPPRWNPVCVMGLRVYAMDSEVSVTLVDVKDAEEGSSLTTDGEPSGATS